MTFQVSLSAYQEWQKCEMRWYLGYVRRLKLKEQAYAPTLGRALHEYLEGYYKSIRDGLSPDDAHLRAQFDASNKFVPEARGYAQTAFLAGMEDLAKEYSELPTKAGSLTDRYYAARGRDDALRYEVLHVEQVLNMEITEGITSLGYTDLVTRDRETGRTNLWEHKSTQYVPQDSVRLRDFQTMLYGIKVRHLLGTPIDSITWNYIRTKEPAVPEVLKSGGLTLRKDIDTTWEVYAATAKRAGIDPYESKYDELRERLDGREMTVFFPRYEVPVVIDESVLMNDYIEESRRMRDAKQAFMAGVRQPIRSLSRDCDYCSFFRVCQAALTGGDEEDVIRMKFTEGSSR